MNHLSRLLNFFKDRSTTDSTNSEHQIWFHRHLVKYLGPRHTTNPSPLSIFWVQKITHKKLMNFSEKVDWQFKTSHHLSAKHLKRHYPLKILPDFDLKELENFWFQKICIFCSCSDTSTFRFHLQENPLVLTKCWPKYCRSIRKLLFTFSIN